MNPLLVTQLGGVTSVVGISLFVLFAAFLLVFPVSKQCDSSGKCRYDAQTPPDLKPVVSPGFLAASLMITAAGILAVRLGRRTLADKAGDSRYASG